MKKYICVTLAIILTLTMLVGCGKKDLPNPSKSKDPINLLPILTIEGGKIASLSKDDFLDLTQNEFEISRTNSKGVTTNAKYKGVTWVDLSKAIGAEKATKVTLISSDGYEKAYDIATLTTGNSIFAIYQDGKNISPSPLEGQIWFCADESLTANYWSKYVNKIKIE
ncbi:MAG: hypothetical protein RRZ69_03180 [Clostridia bacterium]